MKKKIIIVLIIVSACLFLISGCTRVLETLGLDGFAAAVGGIERAEYVESRAEAELNYNGNTTNRSIFFQYNRQGERAYMEFEEDEDSFLLYYYDGTFYLNENGYKTVFRFDFTSMETLSLYDYIDEALLLHFLGSVQISEEDGVEILQIEIDTQAVSGLIEQMMSSVSFPAFPNKVLLKAACRAGKIEYFDVELCGELDNRAFQINVHITYSFEQTKEFPQIDINQFKYASGHRTFYPMKLYPESPEEVYLTDEEYIALPQKWEQGQTEGDEAYICKYDNDIVQLYQYKDGKKRVVLQESVDVINHIAYTFTYTNITIDGEYVYFLGKNAGLYRLHRETLQMEQLDRGAYDFFVIVGNWFVTFGGNGAYAIAKNGLQRYSLNSFYGNNSTLVNLLGMDRGYAYIEHYSADLYQSAVMRVGEKDGELVYERVRLPLDENRNPHIFAINHGIMYYDYGLILEPQDEFQRVYCIDTQQTISRSRSVDGMVHLYAMDEFIINRGSKVLTINWEFDGESNRIAHWVKWVDLKTDEEQKVFGFEDGFEYGRVCDEWVELVTVDGIIYRIEADASITEFNFFE